MSKDRTEILLEDEKQHPHKMNVISYEMQEKNKLEEPYSSAPPKYGTSMINVIKNRRGFQREEEQSMNKKKENRVKARS